MYVEVHRVIELLMVGRRKCVYLSDVVTLMNNMPFQHKTKINFTLGFVYYILFDKLTEPSLGVSNVAVTQ